MTVATKTVFRPALVEDCYAIAHLFRIASDGVSDYIWSTLAGDYPGLTLIEIGAKRYSNETSLFSYKNCLLAERNGEVIGMMLTFPIAEADGSEPASQEMATELTSQAPQEPDVLAPYNLEAPGTWYIAVCR